MSLTWIKKIRIGDGDHVGTEGLLRSDGKWWMWEVSDSEDYLKETKEFLEGKALDPSTSMNDGGEEEFARFFESERVNRGLVYMPVEG